ncbi:site-specific tyrosine recombinase XerD, partial [Stenotrophomonas geniculata]
RPSPPGPPHSPATHPPPPPPDPRAPQMLLFHIDTATTEIYTLVAREHLQKLHARHHPRG